MSRRSNEPTLYERSTATIGAHTFVEAPGPRIVIVKSRWNDNRWWAVHPHDDSALFAPTHARVLELAQEEWGT